MCSSLIVEYDNFSHDCVLFVGDVTLTTLRVVTNTILTPLWFFFDSRTLTALIANVCILTMTKFTFVTHECVSFRKVVPILRKFVDISAEFMTTEY